MKFSPCLVAASLAAASPFYMVEKKAPSPLDVKLEMLGNSEVKATFINNGRCNLKVLKTGTVLDSAAVQKAWVSSGAHEVKFDGLRLRVSTNALSESSFQNIPAGGSVESIFDIAQVHDLSGGGKFTVLANGVFSYAGEFSNKLIGSVPFVSNAVETFVNGTEASAVRLAFHQGRTELQSDCTGDKLQVTKKALQNCASLAKKAQTIAMNGTSAKMEEYFKSSSNSTRSVVAGVLGRVASECGSTNSGASKYYCSDFYNACQDGVLAYTLPSQSFMAYCDLYFKELPPLTTSCHAQDQATTNLHESTHLTQIKGTEDYGGYGYDFVRSLTAEQNLNHADTYALFANAVNLGC